MGKMPEENRYRPLYFFFLLYSFQKKQTQNIGPVPFGAEPLFQIPPWLHCMHTEANVPAQGFHPQFLNLHHTTTYIRGVELFLHPSTSASS